MLNVYKYSIIILLVFFSVSILGYTVPYHGMQEIQNETLNKKIYKTIKFKIEGKEYSINESKNYDDLLLVALSNLFLGKNSLRKFAKKYKIETSKYHLELFNERPVVVYGSKKSDSKISQIWLDKEKAIPVKVIFKFNGSFVTVIFSEFNNINYKYSLPSKVKIVTDDSETTYSIN